jgi:hypothetical protein
MWRAKQRPIGQFTDRVEAGIHRIGVSEGSSGAPIGAATRDERSKQAVIYVAYALATPPAPTAELTLNEPPTVPDLVLAGGWRMARARRIRSPE